MHFLYNLGVRLYGLSISIAAIFNAKAKKWIHGRKDWRNSLPTISSERSVYWFHCASLGEFDQGLPLMELIRHNQPETYILITFFSPSGMEFHHKRNHPGDHVMYLPLDTPKNAKDFITHFQPKKAFFIKYEFWLNYIFEAKNNHVKLYNVSGLFRKGQRFFRATGGLFRDALADFEHFFVQNLSSKVLLENIGISNVSITGDCRFDRVVTNRDRAESDDIIERFKGDQAVFIIGSSWPEDEKLLLPFISKNSIKAIIAPHNVTEQSISAILKALPGARRYTDGISEELESSKTLILDTIGHLSNAFQYGDFAYIGGGFSGKLHNILEPAVFGLPVMFGPKHSRFPEAGFFIEEGIGFAVENETDLKEAITIITNHIEDLRERTTSFVNENLGASEKIFKFISSN